MAEKRDKIVVLGGEGFIGTEIIRMAIEEGRRAVSVSRDGRPTTAGPWAEQVTWVEASVLQPETWRRHLRGAKAVIHCVGIIREQPEEGITFERIHRDSVEMAVFEAEKANVERFVFLSANMRLPFISSRFLTSKRDGENAVEQSNLRHFILRPAFVHGPERPATMLVGSLLETASHVPGLSQFVQEDRPLRVEQVAFAALRAATDLDYEGSMNPDDIAYVAGDGWRALRGTNGRMRLAPLLLTGAAAGAFAGVLWSALRDR